MPFPIFFSPINGAFDAILSAVHLESLIRSWLSDPKIVNYVLAFVSLWRFSGYHIILFMAALQSIPQDQLEAAEVDGATTWQLFKYIQVPAIMLMVDFVLFDNIMRGFAGVRYSVCYDSGRAGVCVVHIYVIYD